MSENRDGPTDPATDGDPHLVYVVLGSRAETDAWRKERGLSHSQVVQVSTRAKAGPRGLEGRLVVVVELPSWMLASPKVRDAVARDLALLSLRVPDKTVAPQEDAVAGPPEGVPDLRVAVREAIKEMPWLTGSDKALQALALRQAAEIEAAIDRASELDALYQEAGDASPSKRLDRLAAMCDVTKVVGWLGPQLQGVLRALGGTPEARKAILGKTANKGGRLAAMQEAAAQDFDGEEAGAEDEDDPAAGSDVD